MSLFLFLFLILFVVQYSSNFIITVQAQAEAGAATGVSIVGCVYCDVCYAYDNTFSNHTYFLPGVDVNVECKLKWRSGDGEEISLSVNRTTDRYGMYAVHIPSVGCNQDPTALQSSCRATLIGVSGAAASACSVPAIRATTVPAINGGCTYTLAPLTFRPPHTNATLCTSHSWNSSKFFLPPYLFPWPQLPPFSSDPPSLPFPFPSIPPPAPPPRSMIPPPVFNFWDPNTWIPHPPPQTRR